MANPMPVARGRPKGSVSKITKQAREAAMAMGLLPHEWLLKVARGDAIEQKRIVVKYDGRGGVKSREVITEEFYPDFDTRMDAAKAAAPYYAPRLAVQQVAGPGGNPDEVVEAMKEVAEKLPV